MEIFVHNILEGVITDLLNKLNPKLYTKKPQKVNRKLFMFVKLNNLLCGTIQTAMLFCWYLTQKLTEDFEFEINPYDWCVVSKYIDGKQCNIVYHVDDLKISHVGSNIVGDMFCELNKKYRQETLLILHEEKYMITWVW